MAANHHAPPGAANYYLAPPGAANHQLAPSGAANYYLAPPGAANCCGILGQSQGPVEGSFELALRT